MHWHLPGAVCIHFELDSSDVPGHYRVPVDKNAIRFDYSIPVKQPIAVVDHFLTDVLLSIHTELINSTWTSESNLKNDLNNIGSRRSFEKDDFLAIAKFLLAVRLYLYI